MSVFARLKKAREEKKGFTLVELIVVLVILAILAAILVPALLGWIDEARKKQYVLEARNIYMACQAVVDEGYAKEVLQKDDGSGAKYTLTTYLNSKDDRIQELADVDTDADVFDIIDATAAGASGHDAYTISKMQIKFVSAQDSTVVGATLEKGVWTVKTDTGGTPETYATTSD